MKKVLLPRAHPGLNSWVQIINIGIKHGFPCINVCLVLGEMSKSRGFNISRGTGQTLMYWKIMFDRCYCINYTKYLLKLSPFGSQRGEAHFLISVFLVREHRKIQDGGHQSIRPRCFGNVKLVAVQL